MRPLLLILVISLFSIANAECIPKDERHRNMFITQSAATGISQKTFETVLDTLENHYAPIMRARGCPLQVNRLWNDGTVNAQAYIEDGKCQIDMFGGLARYKGMTQNGFLMVACHELGHHLGGAPRYGHNTDWAAVEGQADYFATLRCMKALGKSSSAGSLVLAKVLADLAGDAAPSRGTRDGSVRMSILESHPPAQCRLDTYDMGRVCRATGDLSMADPKPGTCFDYPTATTYGSGSRPRCWFRP